MICVFCAFLWLLFYKCGLVRDHVAVGRDDCLVVGRDVLAFYRDLLASRHRHRQVVQEALGVNGGHATSTSGCHRLPVN